MATIQYSRYTITVSEADQDLLYAQPRTAWRVLLPSYQVIASAPSSESDPRRKGNIYLARLVAARMGLDPKARAGHRNGNALDCTRENIFARPGAIGRLPGIPAPHPRQNPPGLHRHKVGASLPGAYVLCAATLCPNGTCPGRRPVATATRHGTNAAGCLWVLRIPGQPPCAPRPWHKLHELIFTQTGTDSLTGAENQLRIAS